MMETVPSAHFDYRKFAPADRLPAFRQMTASLYETWAQGDRDNFRAEAFGHHVGNLVFNEVQFSPARFLRGSQHVSGEGGGFLSLQAQLVGDELLTMDHGIVRLRPNNIYLRDWAYPFDSQSTAMHMHTIVLPRYRLQSSDVLSKDAPVVSWDATQPEGRMLRKLWFELNTLLGEVSLAEAEVLGDAFLRFVDGLLGYGAPRDAPSTLPAMERFLLARLRRNVGVTDLCRHFHVSRSTVYRLFQRHDGVRAYIGRMRLERAYAGLRNADPARVRVGEIAASWGFYDASAFSRKFRQHFGSPPSEILGTGFVQHEAKPRELIRGAESFIDYTTWLREASEPIR
jgi:AraC-like DNA-binding protein